VPPVQPDHFYGSELNAPRSPDSNGRIWLDPEDDPLAHRGIPVFRPTMDEFEDFEGYVTKIECWGTRSGIVKVIPPAEWYVLFVSISGPLTQ
jgi:jmjN domain